MHSHLYLLDRFGVSDKFYCELTQVCSVMLIEIHNLHCSVYEYRFVPVCNAAM